MLNAKMMTILVCGGRKYDDVAHVQAVLNELLERHGRFVLVNGGAAGADSIAEAWALKECLPVLTMNANWARHKKSAGPIRNKEMAWLAEPDLIVAFPGGNGTWDMIQRGRDLGIEVLKAWND
jgi:predicted Rossmann-fold nucleotide-binding protein